MGHRHKWWGLGVLLAAECMDLLDATVVNVAAPAIHADLHTSSTGLQWIVGGYSLAVAVGLIVGGRLGDIVGRRAMFLAGASGFTLASALCGVAADTPMLVAFRLIQGVAGAVMLPQGLGLLRDAFPDEDQAKAFGVYGPVIGLAAVLGPILGGALVDWDLGGSGWRLVFLINVPLGAAAVAGGWFLLPRSRPSQRTRLDLGGAVLSTAACLAMVYPLIEGRQYGWPWWTYLLIAGSLALFGAFGWHQHRRARSGRDPIVVPSVFTHRGYAAGLVVMLLLFSGMGGLLLTISVFLQLGQHFSAIHTGLTFISMSLGMAVGAGASGAFLGKRFGRAVIQAGAVLSLIGWVLVELVVHRDAPTGTIDLLPGLAVAGLGMGLVVAPLFDVVLASVTDEEIGSASGVLNAIQQLSGAMGVAALGTIFFSAATRHGFRTAVEDTLWVQTALLATLLAASPLLPRWARHPANGTPQAAPGEDHA
ncbi:MFS transporter [Acidiferrimicrobium sp. IK]|uniref:MFS transporter n=1 Tax=Acidiferrimicrobium sp. IK TaxID=2871700 RepID=UPI0021CB0E6C|nr:MFS transporter [Acidiferrimicrobium sp. IK]MCU4183040.1 MFS transporter [Acidiferrimicrobium sp. IK]